MWIDVDNELPEDDEAVLIWDGKRISFGYYTSSPRTFLCGSRKERETGGWVDALDRDETSVPSCTSGVTHWMPLPEPPNAELRREP